MTKAIGKVRMLCDEYLSSDSLQQKNQQMFGYYYACYLAMQLFFDD